MRNIALKLMYNGTAYHGWQIQKNASTVCETLQNAISKITGAPVHLTGCGRTDAGVHAERYVANFRTESRIPLDRLPFAINTHTPVDIAVESAFEVAEDFNAIGSCIKKEYTYRIYNSRVKNPFYVNRAYFYPKHLDEEYLSRAANQFVRIGRVDRLLLFKQFIKRTYTVTVECCIFEHQILCGIFHLRFKRRSHFGKRSAQKTHYILKSFLIALA